MTDGNAFTSCLLILPGLEFVTKMENTKKNIMLRTVFIKSSSLGQIRNSVWKNSNQSQCHSSVH